MIKYQYRRLAEAGVDVRLGHWSSRPMTFSATTWATRLSWLMAPSPSSPAFMRGFKQVMTADDLLGGNGVPGKKIVIVGGGTVGCETADYLAPLVNDLSPANRDVTVIEMTKTLCRQRGAVPVARCSSRACSPKGVHVLTEAKVTEITEDTYQLREGRRGPHHRRRRYAGLPWATAPTLKLADDLAAAGIVTHVLGDAQKCGNIRDAIGDGYKVACEL